MIENSAKTTMSGKSRQKNCTSCIRAKRRCDRRAPTCSRCVVKQHICVYHNSDRDGAADGRDIEQAFIDASCHNSLPTDSRSMIIPDATEFNFGSDAAMNNDISLDSFMNMTDDDFTSMQDQWLIQTEQTSLAQRLGSPADEEVIGAYKKMDNFCNNMEPWHLYDAKAPLSYVMTRVKDFVSDVATRNAAPFLHRYLYRDYTPKCILSCFTVSVLYRNRAPATVAMVMRALHNNVTDLLSSEASRITATPIDKLARAQALFLYQIIRLLDGDIILRAQGERDMALLRTWLRDLCRVRENLGDIAQLDSSELRKQTPIQWETWIFAESVRRTILMAHSFLTLYEAMKDPDKDDDDIWFYVHRWTLSRHLWEADSSSEFARMWKDKPHFIITNYTFEHFLECGRGEDVDEFAEILLSVYKGVDETKEFVSCR